MSDAALRDLLVDSFTRIADLVVRLTSGLSADVAAYRADAEANSPAWLVWHLTRVQDDHVAGLARAPQVWPAWRERFALPFADPDAIGYGQSPAEAGRLRASAELLVGYHAEVHAATLDYLGRLTEAELARVVDERWDPPVTASARLVSVIGDALQHLGQAAYVVGLAERAQRG